MSYELNVDGNPKIPYSGELELDADGEMLPYDYKDDTRSVLQYFALWQDNVRRYSYSWPLNISHRRLLQLPYIPKHAINLELNNISKLQDITLDDEERCLDKLEVQHCPDLKRIGSLPSLVHKLIVSHCAALEKIEAFSEFLRELIILDCPNLKELPPLPRQLKILRLNNTGITVLPPRMGSDLEPTMPEALFAVLYPPTSFVVPMKVPFALDMKAYMCKWQEWHRERVSKERIQMRAKTIKKDLVKSVFAPERIEKLITVYGIEILESL